MLLFRSEEHLSRWLVRHGGRRGGVLSLAQTWELAKRWYPDRRQPTWRARSVDASQAILAGVGLTGEFWVLQPAP